MQLTGQKREILGKKAQSLREQRLLPAVIFSKGKKSLPITLNYVEFEKVFKEAGETEVIDLVIDGKKHPVLVKEIQNHTMTGKPIHVGFYEVDLTQKVTANVPVELINEDKNELVKSGEFMVLSLIDEIEVEALPNDLPKAFVVDLTRLVDKDSVITIADLEYDRTKIEIQGLDPDEVVVKLDTAQMAEEESAEEVSEAEAIENLEATAEKKPGDETSEETEVTPIY